MKNMEKFYRIAIYSYLISMKNCTERYGWTEKRKIRFKLRMYKIPENININEFIDYMKEQIHRDFPHYYVESAEIKRTRIWVTIKNDRGAASYDDEIDDFGYHDQFGMWPGCDIPYITGDE